MVKKIKIFKLLKRNSNQIICKLWLDYDRNVSFSNWYYIESGGKHKNVGIPYSREFQSCSVQYENIPYLWHHRLRLVRLGSCTTSLHHVRWHSVTRGFSHKCPLIPVACMSQLASNLHTVDIKLLLLLVYNYLRPSFSMSCTRVVGIERWLRYFLLPQAPSLPFKPCW